MGRKECNVPIPELGGVPPARNIEIILSLTIMVALLLIDHLFIYVIG